MFSSLHRLVSRLQGKAVSQRQDDSGLTTRLMIFTLVLFEVASPAQVGELHITIQEAQRGQGEEGRGVFILSGCLSTMVAPVFLPILGKDFALETGWMPLTIQDTGLDS